MLLRSIIKSTPRVSARVTKRSPLVVNLARGFSDEAPLRKTPLYDLHVANGATTTGFGGWDMPLYYTDGIMKEHNHCRNAAGLFDVSHMIPCRITGKDRVEFMEKLMPSDLQNLPEGQGTLSSLPNEQGGLIDDCIITNAGDHLYLVINAGHEDKDIPHIQKYMAEFKGDVNLEILTGRGLIALQGPQSAAVMGRLTDADYSSFQFMTGRKLTVAGHECYVTRSGYTGEDGFELMVDGENAAALAATLLDQEEVKPIGLGARDSLRLEAGLCLYGNDIDDTTTPSEAGLLWTIPKSRRVKGAFVGSDIIVGQIENKKLVERKRVGFTAKGPPPRSHDKIFDEDDNEVGEVTSGVYGPTVKHPVGMAYVKKKFAKKGTKLKVEIRGKKRPLTVSPMPFTPANFFRG